MMYQNITAEHQFQAERKNANNNSCCTFQDKFKTSFCVQLTLIGNDFFVSHKLTMIGTMKFLQDYLVINCIQDPMKVCIALEFKRQTSGTLRRMTKRAIQH